MIKVFLILALYALCACSQPAILLSEAHALDVEVISTVTSVYCKLPQRLRDINRARWNSAIKPNSIALHCDGDS